MERTEPRNRIQQRRPPTAGARLAVVPKKLSRLHRPEGTSLEAWQTALRRQFGREQRFLLKNTGGHPIFSEFEVTNPESRNVYRVAIRGSEPGNNFCSCPDFATNTLGTCKHIEFALARLGRNSENRKALARAFEPPFSEVYLHYGAQRQVRFRPRAGASAALTRLAAQYFDGGGTLRTEAFVQFETFLSAAARLDPDLRCYEDALDFVAQVRDAERREKVLAEVFPRGIRSAAFKNLLRVPLLPARGGALRQPRGSLPHRRRHGPGENHGGHRRCRDHGPPLRRRARARRVSDFAQASVGARNRQGRRPARPRHRRLPP